MIHGCWLSGLFRLTRRAVKGVFVGFYDEEAKKIRTGFSRVNLEPRDKNNKVLPADKFNMEQGIAIAIQEAVLPNQKVKDNDENQYFWDHYINFKDRANRYFRQAEMDAPAARVSRVRMVINPAELAGAADLGWFSLARELMANHKPIVGISSVNKEEADMLLGRIAKRFKELGYTPKQVFPMIKGLGVADKEGLALIKKHFPELDVSAIKVV